MKILLTIAAGLATLTSASIASAMTRDAAMATDCMAMPHKGANASHG